MPEFKVGDRVVLIKHGTHDKERSVPCTFGAKGTTGTVKSVEPDGSMELTSRAHAWPDEVALIEPEPEPEAEPWPIAEPLTNEDQDELVDAQVLGMLSDEQHCRITALHEARDALAIGPGSAAYLIATAEWILSGHVPAEVRSQTGLDVDNDDA